MRRIGVVSSGAELALSRRKASSGTSPARGIAPARALLGSHEGLPRDRAAREAGVAVLTVERVRRRFAEGGLEAAPSRRAQRSRPEKPKLADETEARLTALARSEAPQGRARWTPRPRAGRAVERGVVEDAPAPCAEPHGPAFPAICLDETPARLLSHASEPLPARRGDGRKEDRRPAGGLEMRFTPKRGSWLDAVGLESPPREASAPPAASRAWKSRGEGRRPGGTSGTRGRPACAGPSTCPAHGPSSRGSTRPVRPDGALGQGNGELALNDRALHFHQVDVAKVLASGKAGKVAAQLLGLLVGQG